MDTNKTEERGVNAAKQGDIIAPANGNVANDKLADAIQATGPKRKMMRIAATVVGVVLASLFLPATAHAVTMSSLTSAATGVAAISRSYFSVRGGDVAVGQGMSMGGVDCALPANYRGSAVSWNRGATGAFLGAGTQYAAFVLNHLQDFSTAQGNPMTPSGLAFSNTAAGLIDQNAGLFGGRFNGGKCMADYFAGATNVIPGGRLLSTLPNFPANGNVPNGTTTTYYVDGDLYVDSNVRFSGVYPGVNQIPSFSLVVRGNILIDRNVSQLDGIYIAQPGGQAATNGIIFTCATDSTPPFLPPGLDRNVHDQCFNNLVVNGSLTARQIWLLRSTGDVASTPAETVNYLPELWLSVKPGSGKFEPSKYDSITSLPPVL